MKESFTAVQCALHTHYHTEPPGGHQYWKPAQTQFTVASDTGGGPRLLPLQMHPLW